VYNKPNGCSATGALAPGPDHQQQKHTGIVKNIHRMLNFILPPDTTKSNYMCLYAQHVLASGFLGFYWDVVEVSVLVGSEAISLFSDILTLEGETTTMH
jgi:hypothetical protein